MKRDIEDILKKIESELEDIYLSYDTAYKMLIKLDSKLNELDIATAAATTSWSHLTAGTRALRDRLKGNLTVAEVDLLHTIIDILDSIEKQH